MMDKIVQIVDRLIPIDSIEADKKTHFVCGFIICLLFGLIDQQPLTGFWIGTGAAFAKELYDEFYSTGFSYKDLLYTEVGVILAYALL